MVENDNIATVKKFEPKKQYLKIKSTGQIFAGPITNILANLGVY